MRSCLKAEFQGLTKTALEARWDRYEVALALANLGDLLVDGTANTDSEADVAIAKALFEINRASAGMRRTGLTTLRSRVVLRRA